MNGHTLGTGHYLSPGGGAEDLGGIRWLSEELREGSAVIDRRKGGIRPKQWNFRSRQDPRGGGGRHSVNTW